MKRNAISGYECSADKLIERYQSVSSKHMFAPFSHLLPQDAARVLDVGAGTGRDAAWFAKRGQQVLAVEPVAAFRAVGAESHETRDIEWLDDKLPDLARVRARGQLFDLAVLNGIWHHLLPEQRQLAMRNLAKLLFPGGIMVLSLRHGPGSPTRPCYPVDPEMTAKMAAPIGMRLVFSRAKKSVQAENRRANVIWTWQVYRSD